MQRREGADLAPPRPVGEPAAAAAQDAVLDAEQGLRAEAPPRQTRMSGSASSIWRSMKGLQIATSCGVGVRLPGGRQGTTLAI